MQNFKTADFNSSWLIWFLRGLLALGFLILISKLFELQIIKGDYYRDLSDSNRIQRIKIKAPRGNIYARSGEILSGPDFAHITGYVQETNKDEVGKIDPKCVERGPYRLGQMVGRSGLQEEYNCILSGIDGEELIEVNSRGEKLRLIGKKEPVAGKSLKTNIDYGLQKLIAMEMKDKIGSVVATDKFGRVLALFSSPTFDPDDIQSALANQDLPLFNRALWGLYHPGSVFKPLVALIALEEEKIDKNFKFNDTGEITIESPYGNYSFSNWYYTQYGKVEGEVDLVKALARSTDTFFYKIGELVGIEKLVDGVKKLGLTGLTGIDIRGEILNLIPSADWKQRVKKERWFLGNTYHFSIGQGDLALTPVSLHRSDLIIANKGKLCNLKIVGDTKCIDLKLKAENLKLIEDGMKNACSAGGTGYTFFNFKEKTADIDIACKTGTAETNEDGKTHAWFVAYNIEDNRQSDNELIFLTIMVEKSGEGSKVAGPIARSVFDYYFGIKKSEAADE